MPFVSPAPVRRRTRAAVAVLPLALVPLALAGCTGSGGGTTPAPGPGPSEGTSSGVSTPAPLPSDVTPAPIPTKVANNPDDRKNVVMSACAATKDGWGASGTATNAGKNTVSYNITVFFTTTSATTIDSARTKVEVKAGETVKWTADKTFKAPKDMLCVLRGVDAV